MLRVPNPTLFDRVWAMSQKQHFIKVPFAPANLNFKALSAFEALGSQGSNAVPSLIAIFEADPSAFPQTAVPVILGHIGPAAEQAIPALLQGIAHTNAGVRNDAIVSLGNIHAQPKLVVPALIQCLNDPEAIVPAEAAWALGRFGRDARSAVPALLALRRKEALNPGAASRTTMKPAGFSPMPTFTSRGGSSVVMSSWGAFPGRFSSNPDLVGSTTEALDKIDPRSFANDDLK
jgi:hypothetical protein